MDGQLDFLGLISEYTDDQGAHVKVREPGARRYKPAPPPEPEQLSFDLDTASAEAKFEAIKQAEEKAKAEAAAAEKAKDEAKPRAKRAPAGAKRPSRKPVAGAAADALKVDEADVKAKFEDGVLDICVPKHDPKKLENKKYIAIEG